MDSGTKVSIIMPKEAPPSAPPTQAVSQTPAHESLNMCHGCPALCCDLRVDLTLFDIVRILHMEGRQAEEFIELAPASKEDCFAIRLEGGMFKLVLQHENGMCTFFRNGELRCTIENAKPGICLGYPFSIRDGIPYIRKEVVCPFNNLMRADRAKMSAKTLEAMVWEARRYEDAVSAWNGSAKDNESLGAFLRFASNDLDADRSSLGGLKKGLGRFMLRVGLR